MAASTHAQLAQPNSPPPGAKLELSSASEAAKNEFWLGLDDWQNFSYSSSQAHFDRAVSLDPNFGLARAFAAAVPAINGAPISTSELDRGIVDAARSSTAEGLLALAWREKALGHIQPTIVLFRAATELMPNEPRVASEYIWSLAGTDVKGALEAGRAAKAKFPNAGVISPALAFALLQSGDTAAAVAEAARYTQNSPAQPVSFVTYGDYLRMQRRYDEAEAQYRRSLTLGPKHGDGGSDGVVALASLALERGKPAVARQALADVLVRTPSASDSVSYLHLLAAASLYASDLSGAMSALEQASRIAPRARQGVGAFYPNIELALANAVFGDRKSVSKYLAPIRPTSAGDSTQFDWLRADIYAYSGPPDSAFKYADKLAARGATDTGFARGAHFMRGRTYQTIGQCDKALAEFQQADSTSVEVQAGKAECEMKAGHRAAALRYRDMVLARSDINLYDPGEIRARMRMSEMR